MVHILIPALRQPIIQVVCRGGTFNGCAQLMPTRPTWGGPCRLGPVSIASPTASIVGAHHGGALESPVSEGQAIDFFIGCLENDEQLERGVRQKAAELRRLGAQNPAVALEQLRALAEEVTPTLPRRAPTDSLARCVNMETFLRYHVRPEIGAFFEDAAQYRAFVSRAHIPEVLLLDHLDRAEPLFEASHSWLVAYDDIKGMSGRDLMRALGLAAPPPYALMQLSVGRLLKAGVTVRSTTSLDAALSGTTLWDPKSLPTGLGEVIDGNVPQAALEGIEWRP